MTVDEFLKVFPCIPVTRREYAAMKALEDKGKRFLVDFGYENAVSLWAQMKPHYSLDGRSIYVGNLLHEGLHLESAASMPFWVINGLMYPLVEL